MQICASELRGACVSRIAALLLLLSGCAQLPEATVPEIQPPVDAPPAPQYQILPSIELYESQSEALTVGALAGSLREGRVEVSKQGRKVTAALSPDAISFAPPSGWVGNDTISFRIAAATVRDTTRIFTLPIRVKAGPFLVDRNPYAEVEWGGPRWKVQLHDHPGVNPANYQAYDQAGYHGVVLMDYSGVPSLNVAWKQRRYPPEQWLPASLLNNFANIRILIPGAEEVGAWHVTSPFLTQWISKWEAAVSVAPRAWEYTTTQEAIDKVSEYGGMPILAHPWLAGKFDAITGLAGMEIYSAFASYRAEEAKDTFYTLTDRNAVLMKNWDSQLRRDSRTIGVAVNDHFGPGSTEAGLTPRTRDSGKILAFAPTLTLASLRSAMERGAIFAVRDRGETKDHYPVVDSISVTERGVQIWTAESVRWVANGTQVGNAAELDFDALSPGTSYVRAEIENNDGSVIYTQAFGIRRMTLAERRTHSLFRSVSLPFGATPSAR